MMRGKSIQILTGVQQSLDYSLTREPWRLLELPRGRYSGYPVKAAHGSSWLQAYDITELFLMLMISR